MTEEFCLRIIDWEHENGDECKVIKSFGYIPNWLLCKMSSTLGCLESVSNAYGWWLSIRSSAVVVSMEEIYACVFKIKIM